MKQNNIQSESELTEDGSIKNVGGWDLACCCFLLSFIYSPGLMFSFLVIFQDLSILFISKLYLVLLL